MHLSRTRTFGLRSFLALLQSMRDRRAVRAIARSGLFDWEWYLKSNPDVAALGINPIRHYVAYGAREGRDPSPSFSTLGYLLHNRDVAEAGVNPLEHFVRCGAAEGRNQQPSIGPTLRIAARPPLLRVSSLPRVIRSLRPLSSPISSANSNHYAPRGRIDQIVARNQIIYAWGWFESRLADARPTIRFGSATFGMIPNAFPIERRDVNAMLGDNTLSKRGLLYLLDTNSLLVPSHAIIDAYPNFAQSIVVDEVSSSFKVLCLIFEHFNQIRKCVGSLALYNIPDSWFPILKKANQQMAWEEATRKRVVRSERIRSTKPAASVIFVQCGPLPLLPFCFSALSTCGCELELVLVNNSAHLRSHTLRLLSEAERLHGLSFTYIELENNIGFGSACNIAAEEAQGELLLFHNNDVLPTSPDDYSRVFKIAAEGRFIVGARQFFPRGDIMHDGIRLGILDAYLADGRTDIISGFSLGRGVPPARLFGPVLTSGSLMCLKASLFKSVGGFSTEYLFGHFEDLDLCLRLRQKGIETRIVDTNFVHSEGGGSDVPEYLSKTVPYVNRRIFTSKWQSIREHESA